jgi:hypothetical protein
LRLATAGAYVACAWLEWRHGTIDGPFAGRIVVQGAGQSPTVYYGTTSQRLPRSKLGASSAIAFETIDGQVVNLSYLARYTCTRPGRRVTHPIFSTVFPVFGLSTATAFSDTFVQGTDRAVVSGTVSRRRGRGTLSEAYTSGGFSCSSGPISFTVRQG